MRSKDIEWALAGFEVDNLWHQTYTFARQSHILRTTGSNAEREIYIQYQLLQQSFQCWKQRNMVIEQEEIEKFSRIMATPTSDPFTEFLHYESLSLEDRFYAKLLNQWCGASIYASIILPFPDKKVQTAHAIDICRTTAALGYEGFSGPQWECLFYAGMVLDGEVEREWIIERCKMIALQMPNLSPYVDKPELAWRQGRRDWNPFGKVYPHKADNWFGSC
jgi:hypothetical protein